MNSRMTRDPTRELHEELKLRNNVIYNDPILVDLLLDESEDSAIPSTPSGAGAEEHDAQSCYASTQPGTMDTVISSLLDDGEVNGALKAIKAVGETRYYHAGGLRPHLLVLFEAIEREFAKVANHRPYFRQLVAKDNRPATEEFVSPDLPDFSLAEVPPPTEGFVTEPFETDRTPLWRQCPAFVGMKARWKGSPNGVNENTVTSALVQGASHARTILDARPFQLFVYGIFFYSDLWVLGRFDRQGVVLGKDESLFVPDDNDPGPGPKFVDRKGFTRFVRAVIRLTWELSPESLGHDPTVVLLPGHHYYSDMEYPRFLVKGTTEMGDLRTWGPPIQSSHSLLGGGTFVWRAIDVSTLSPVTLKNAWRSENRMSESAIYGIIHSLYGGNSAQLPPGIARFRGGEDVNVGGKWLSVKTLRHKDHSRHLQDDEGLHRVVLSDYGKALCDCAHPIQLMQATLMSLEALQSLAGMNLFHCDVTADKIMIRQSAKYKGSCIDDEVVIVEDLPEAEGFVLDFELALLPVNPPETTSEQPGRPITGTAIFAATKVLMAIVHDTTITYTAKHDTESLCWAFIFAAYRMALRDKKYPPHRLTHLEAEFMGPFARNTDAQDTISRRMRAVAHTTDRTVPGIEQLQRYLTHTRHDVLRRCVEYVWVILFMLQQNLRLESELQASPMGDIVDNWLLAPEEGRATMAYVPDYNAPECKDPTSDLIRAFQKCVPAAKKRSPGFVHRFLAVFYPFPDM